jgi:hypothetical protein
MINFFKFKLKHKGNTKIMCNSIHVLKIELKQDNQLNK